MSWKEFLNEFSPGKRHQKCPSFVSEIRVLSTRRCSQVERFLYSRTTIIIKINLICNLRGSIQISNIVGINLLLTNKHTYSKGTGDEESHMNTTSDDDNYDHIAMETASEDSQDAFVDRDGADNNLVVDMDDEKKKRKKLHIR